MNYTLFLAIMNLILISRLRFTLRDQGVTGLRDLLWMGIIPMLILPFLTFNTGFLILAGFLILHPSMIRFLEKSDANRSRNRMTLLIAFVVLQLLA